MDKSQTLKGFKILDLSHRLPGPLGTHILTQLGAQVTKIEDQKFKDAFLEGLFSDFDSSFKYWYENLNKDKEVIRLDFKSDDFGDQLDQYLAKSDAVLLSLPPKLIEKFQLNPERLAQINPNLAVVVPGSSKRPVGPMHDLNALALTGLLDLYLADKEGDIVSPPFLPLTGIGFGQQIASDILASLLRAKTDNRVVWTETFLLETAEEVYLPFWPQQDREVGKTKFLHNGAFPCYCLYRTSDNQMVAVAAVEEKFWLEFAEIFNIEFDADNRFNRSQDYFQQVAQKIKALSFQEVNTKLAERQICVSTVKLP